MLYYILHCIKNMEMTSVMECFIIDPAMRCAALRTPNSLTSGCAVIYVRDSATSEPQSEPHYMIALLNYVNALLIDEVRFLMIVNTRMNVTSEGEMSFRYRQTLRAVPRQGRLQIAKDIR